MGGIVLQRRWRVAGKTGITQAMPGPGVELVGAVETVTGIDVIVVTGLALAEFGEVVGGRGARWAGRDGETTAHECCDSTSGAQDLDCGGRLLRGAVPANRRHVGRSFPSPTR